MSSNNRTIKLGLFGTGKMAKIRAELVAAMPGVEISFVASQSQERAKQFARDHNIPTALSSYSSTLHDYLEHNRSSVPDAVLICSTADYHSELAIGAASLGSMIFCEKPAGNDLEDMDETIRTINENGVSFQVGFNRRFDPKFKELRAAIDDGRTGAVEQINIISRDPQAPSPENLSNDFALLSETTVHDLDMAYYLGGPISSVLVLGGVLINPAFKGTHQIDTATVLLDFASGAQGVIQNSWRSEYGYDQRVEMHATNGTFFVENMKPNSLIIADSFGRRESAQHCSEAFFRDRYIESYRLELEDFIRCLRTGTKPSLDAEHAYYVASLVEAAKESYCSGRWEDVCNYTR